MVLVNDHGTYDDHYFADAFLYLEPSILTGPLLLFDPSTFRLQRAYRTIDQTRTRTTRELDIRRDLRNWDNQYPEIHHELIVRWVVGALVSVTVTSFYNSFKRALFSSGRQDPYRRF